MDANGHSQAPAEWRELYEAALLELDPARVAIAIHRAEQAIYAHLKTLEPPGDSGDQQVLFDALTALADLRRATAKQSP